MGSQVIVNDLGKTYDSGFEAVRNMSFTVDEGEIVGVIGPNGAGKTTTLKMLAGLIRPTTGDATINGSDIQDSETKYNIGFLPEESPIYDSMTAVSYLKFFADLYDVDRDVAEKRIHQTLDELDLEYRDRKIGDMSKGMTRKVLIARSLINDPTLLVYDEPASGLDPYTTNYIIDYIGELADRGKSIVFSAHNLYHVESLCDKVIIVDNGEIQAKGSVDEIQEQYGSPEYEIILYENVDGIGEPYRNDYRVIAKNKDELDTYREQLSDQNIKEVYKKEQSLETIFLDLVDIKQ